MSRQPSVIHPVAFLADPGTEGSFHHDGRHRDPCRNGATGHPARSRLANGLYQAGEGKPFDVNVQGPAPWASATSAPIADQGNGFLAATSHGAL